MTTKRHRGDRLAFRAIPTAIIQQIALYIPDSKDFFSYLSCFQDAQGSGTLGDLQHFLKLSTQLDPTDLWPKLRLRQLTPSLAPSVRCITRFFTTIFVFEVYDVRLLEQCLHPQNVVDLFAQPSHDGLCAWLTAPLSILPVQRITFHAPDNVVRDLFVEQLGNMPNLVSLTLKESYMDMDSMDPLFAFIQVSSKLTWLSLSSLYVSNRTDRRIAVSRRMGARPPRGTLQGRNLEILTEWLRRCPVRLLMLGKWSMNQDDQPGAMALLHAIFASSTLENIMISCTPLCRFAAMTSFAVPNRMQSLDFIMVWLNDTAMASLATGLRHSSITSSLLDVLPETNIQTHRLRFMGLDDDACTAIAAVLPSSKIVFLDLTGAMFTYRGAQELCKAIASATTLTSLHLGRSRITLQGVADLVEALKVRPQLKIYLDQSNRCIQDMSQEDHIKVLQSPW
ncbi:unnamed protein product [Aphanomyces euteiches]